ncbi:MAG: hypothetical protein ACREP7_01920 [Lysobacter sp.]
MKAMTQGFALKRMAIVAAIVAAALFSAASSALPVPPAGSGWLVYSYYGATGDNDAQGVVGMRYQGAGCPGPKPQDWGMKTSKFTYHYASCNGGGQN